VLCRAPATPYFPPITLETGQPRGKGEARKFPAKGRKAAGKGSTPGVSFS